MSGTSESIAGWRRASCMAASAMALLLLAGAATAQVVVGGMGRGEIIIQNGQAFQLQNGRLVPVAGTEPGEKFATPEELKKAFDQIVKDLSSNDFALRQKASERLSAGEQFDLALLETALKRPDLTLEARSRLMAVARQRFFRTPRAALGFQFGGALRDRVVVGQTFAKFPSARLLEEGDMIVGADGYKLEGPGARFLLQAIIISHDPGEILKLAVRRGGRKIDLDVPLGRFNDLDNGAAALMEDRLTRAWRIRAQSRLGAVTEPIRLEAPEAPWGMTEDQANRKMQAAMQREANEPQVQLVGGGMPRGARTGDPDQGMDFMPRQQVIFINGQARVVQGGFGMRAGLGDWDPETGLQPLKPQEELAQLLEARQVYDRRAGSVDPDNLPPDDPRRRELQDARKSRDLIVKQMEAIQAEIAEKQASTGEGKHSAADANDHATP